MSFSNLDAALEKNKVDLDAELKAEMETHLFSFSFWLYFH